MISNNQQNFDQEIKGGKRFAFGKNWASFLQSFSDEKLLRAENDFKSFLDVKDLTGKKFLDIGSGSGLSSLVANRLGAQVFSFDYDPHSVQCTELLKQKLAANQQHWSITQGSALDEKFMDSLGEFDVVYSWGVLHHTGDMWKSLNLVKDRVKKDGLLYLAIYNDQGFFSYYWKFIKILYNRFTFARFLFPLLFFPYLVAARYTIRLVAKKGKLPRGMNLWHDMIDWLGGHPFEVASPEQIFSFYKDRGFALEALKTCRNRMGCNEFVFRKL